SNTLLTLLTRNKHASRRVRGASTTLNVRVGRTQCQTCTRFRDNALSQRKCVQPCDAPLALDTRNRLCNVECNKKSRMIGEVVYVRCETHCTGTPRANRYCLCAGSTRGILAVFHRA